MKLYNNKKTCKKLNSLNVANRKGKQYPETLTNRAKMLCLIMVPMMIALHDY